MNRGGGVLPYRRVGMGKSGKGFPTILMFSPHIPRVLPDHNLPGSWEVNFETELKSKARSAGTEARWPLTVGHRRRVSACRSLPPRPR